MYVRRYRRGFGDCAYEGDPTCETFTPPAVTPGNCYPYDFVGPIPPGSSYCAPNIQVIPAVVTLPPSTPATQLNCYPANFVGPLPPGGAYCSQPGAAGCPAGSNCSIFAGVPNMGVYALGAILASFLVFGAMQK